MRCHEGAHVVLFNDLSRAHFLGSQATISAAPSSHLGLTRDRSLVPTQRPRPVKH
jgi:hypothetical protein